MPGFFNRVGTYMAGAGVKGLAQMRSNPALRRTVMGAGMGAAYGIMSDDTSVLGGGLMGAAAGRYLGAGIMRAAHSGKSIGSLAKKFTSGVKNMAQRDMMRVRSRGHFSTLRVNDGFGVINRKASARRATDVREFLDREWRRRTGSAENWGRVSLWSTGEQGRLVQEFNRTMAMVERNY